jgi:hypothetical protein
MDCGLMPRQFGKSENCKTLLTQKLLVCSGAPKTADRQRNEVTFVDI